MPQQRSHVVHLAVTCARVAAAAVDLLHDHRGFRQAQAGAAVFLRDQRGEPSRLRERVDECFGIRARFVELAEIRVGKVRAERAHGLANLRVTIGPVFHDLALPPRQSVQSPAGAERASRAIRRFRSAGACSARAR